MNSQADLKKEISKIIDGHRDEIIEKLGALVNIPSVTGNEGDAQKYVATLYRSLGLEIVSFEPDLEQLMTHPAFSRRENNPGYKDRPNILGILPGKKDARSVKLNAHVDTVSAEPVNEWDSPPWEAKVVGNLMYGRGAQDDKHGIIANFYALKSLLESDFKPIGTVILESVVEEEGGGAGSLASLMKGYVTDGIVFMDSFPSVVTGIVGSTILRLKVKGRTMHAGWADYGVNAIQKMNTILEAVAEIGEKRMREVHVPLFETPARKVTVTYNIGSYKAGTGPSIVPGQAEVECRFSVAPGETVEAVRKQVEDAINSVARHDSWLKENLPAISWYGAGIKGWLQDPEHPFVKIFKQNAEDIAGQVVPLAGMTAAADARFAPYFNVPALMCGASGNSHAVNEFVDLDSVILMTKIIAGFIIDWCGVIRKR